MSAQVIRYKHRQIAERSGADNEVEFYTDPVGVDWSKQPCHCAWNVLKRELLDIPEPTDPVAWACACVGPSCIVPGYPHNRAKMRAFAEEQEGQYLCDLMLTALSGSGLVPRVVFG